MRIRSASKPAPMQRWQRPLGYTDIIRNICTYCSMTRRETLACVALPSAVLSLVLRRWFCAPQNARLLRVTAYVTEGGVGLLFQTWTRLEVAVDAIEMTKNVIEGGVGR